MAFGHRVLRRFVVDGCGLPTPGPRSSLPSGELKIGLRTALDAVRGPTFPRIWGDLPEAEFLRINLIGLRLSWLRALVSTAAK